MLTPRSARSCSPGNRTGSGKGAGASGGAGGQEGTWPKGPATRGVCATGPASKAQLSRVRWWRPGLCRSRDTASLASGTNRPCPECPSARPWGNQTFGGQCPRGGRPHNPSLPQPPTLLPATRCGQWPLRFWALPVGWSVPSARTPLRVQEQREEEGADWVSLSRASVGLSVKWVRELRWAAVTTPPGEEYR